MVTRQVFTLAFMLASVIKHGSAGSASSAEVSIEYDTEVEVDSKASLLLQAHKSQSVSSPMTHYHHRGRNDPISTFFMTGQRDALKPRALSIRLNEKTAPNDMSPLFDELEDHLRAKFGEDHLRTYMEGHIEDHGPLVNQTMQYDQWAQSGFISICETGFNAGHSALRFLAQSTAHLYEFDLDEHEYSKVAADYLQEKYPDRLTMIWGDSTMSMPAFRSNFSDVGCDLMIVDGGHKEPIAKSDLVNFALMAKPNAIIAIDDTPCTAEWCQGPKDAWDELVSHGCIKTKEAIAMGDSRGFTYGEFTPCDYVSEFFGQ